MSITNGYRAVFIALVLFTSTSVLAEEIWEYHVKTFPLLGDDLVLTQALNEQGLLGWELVNCTEGDAQLTCIFKRETEG